MKIGIITHWMAVDNYGGILQAYALQQYLRDLGHDAFIIRFYVPKKQNTISYIKNKLINLISYLNTNTKRGKQRKYIKMRNFSNFREKHINLSPRIYNSLKEIQTHYPETDILITGSDQVWAFDLTYPENWIYYLDFGNNATKRVSYAASFGFSTFPGKDSQKFKSLLKRFDKISVREINGIKICQEQGFNAIRCVDSTLLLNKSKYKILASEPKYKNRFAFFYTVNVTRAEEIYWNEIQQYLKEKKLQCIVTTGSGYSSAKEIFDNAIYDYATVEGWLSNIYYSDIVFTSSFHGIVFAFIFQKDFIYIPLKNHSSGNDRIFDFLSITGLESRVANSFNDIKSILEFHIDYNNLKDNLYKDLLSDSYNFLDSIIKEDKK